ncbi:hypothetical protein PC118_g10251 [Phytophthora cactorum]|uniref:non-specific serine/threonine protein kinase n=1 Tax=Phytophthora cactorum TaxID=29920 RepID=A0A8T0ZTR1_9STRA|nr:hypothetical protein PC113_g3255 [Phytophthora cactorum]KAG2940206.1 hypothetical protein PC115_g2686 [Phytophthora cactorum]KAG2981975.1 hypothetical protein PC118_g10251 [Phytophthora cactorum]KAG3035508.1 hypothetical protein PC119_g4569 [Phytophthora cactorum]KAG3049241.1 hypothetical protein PC121_g19012 [Phytophthora cactorum]
MAERPQQLALARVAELEFPTDGSGRRTSASSTSSSDMERLHEELQLEIKPQRLQRQYTLNVPPFSAGGDQISRTGLLDAAPDVLEDVLTRWEINQVKWRRSATGDGNQDFSTEDDTATVVEDGEDPFEDVQRAETFDVTFGDGFLGLEFVVDALRSKVMIKSVHMETWTTVVLSIPPGVTITRGLTVDAVNGRDASAMSPEDVLDNLQFSRRPMTVKFRRPTKSAVVCKLCETKMDANSLDEHTNYCVLSKRVELEADVINDSLVKFTASINAALAAEAMRPMFNQDEVHIYHALRVVAIQASTCDVTSVDAFALCARLVKIIDRIRQQEVEMFERGDKYCSKLRTLIHAKMSKMRASHKAMLKQAPAEAERLPLKRTKSLENIENSDGLRTSRRTSLKSASFRVSIRDFHIVKPISKGAFGKVYLARKKTTGDQYAIKVLAKEHLLRKKQIQQIETERNILASVVSPFVVKLFWTFQTKRNLFLVMEYLPGGDFMSLLECIVQLEEQVACVYIAEIAIALNHLHTKGCVHRDLKPDNILLSSTGHIKLTDFGLSEEAMAMSDTDSEPDDESMTQAPDVLVPIPLEEAPSAPPENRPRRTLSFKKKKNLTDVFIDDDEFDVGSPSASSSQNIDSGPESDEQPASLSDPKGDEDFEAGDNNTSTAPVATADVDMSWGTAGALGTLDGVDAAHDEFVGDGVQTEDNNSIFRFPSGMYGSPDDSNLSDAFRSFSFTNMNALAAASQAEADIMITDTEQQTVDASGPSILI